MPLCEVCYSESLEGERYCSQCASVLGITSAQEEQPIILPATPLPLPTIAPAFRATGDSTFSRLRAKWMAMDAVLRLSLTFATMLVTFLAVVLIIAFSIYPSSQLNYSTPQTMTAKRDSTPPPSPPIAPRNRTPSEHLDRAKTYLADPQQQYDLDQAKSELEQIPKDAYEYTEAHTLLAKLAAGKYRLPSEFELKYASAIVKLRQVSPDVTYGKLKKNADKFIGQAWAFTGKVLEIHEQGSTTTARVGVGSYGLDAVYIECPCTTDLVEDNAVFVVGTVQGNYTYETVAGWTLSIPKVSAAAMVNPREGTKLRAAAQRN